MASKHDALKKTNAMRILDAAGVVYQTHSYTPDASLSGVDVATLLGEDPERVFKTLVAESKEHTYYVFVIPVESTLNLKKAAYVAHEKAIAMCKSKELLGLCGYVHGGCSPIGMKKSFPTFIDETALLFTDTTIMCSGGRIGLQIELSPLQLSELTGASFVDLCE